MGQSGAAGELTFFRRSDRWVHLANVFDFFRLGTRSVDINCDSNEMFGQSCAGRRLGGTWTSDGEGRTRVNDQEPSRLSARPVFLGHESGDAAQSLASCQLQTFWALLAGRTHFAARFGHLNIQMIHLMALSRTEMAGQFEANVVQMDIVR